MKPKNFPAKKLRRQIRAQQGAFAETSPENQLALDAARNIRTKKYRGPAR